LKQELIPNKLRHLPALSTLNQQDSEMFESQGIDLSSLTLSFVISSAFSP
jgi:hypothetical protein